MEYRIRPFVSGEEHYVAELHKRLYANEYGWGAAFTDYAAKIALDFAKKDKNNREALLIAESGGVPVGCIMLCLTDDPQVGQLRLFAVEQACRGQGIGSALISALMDIAKNAAYQKLVLWTADPLTAAIRRYEHLGFRKTETVKNTTWRTDGGEVDEIKMEMDLSA